MSSGDASCFPPTKWAQQKELILLTFCVEDCKNADVKFESNKILFEGQGGTMNQKYKSEFELFKEIIPEESRWESTSRYIFIHAQKKESTPFWPRLLNSKAKQHWLKVDFDKMKYEDDSSEEEDNMPMGAGQPGQGQPDLAQMMAQMGKGPGMMDFGDMDDGPDSDDSDDEELPELESASTEAESKPKENGSTEPVTEPQACDA